MKSWLKSYKLLLNKDEVMVMKKKILYLILNGDTYGGSEKHVVDLYNLVSDTKYVKYLIYSKGNSMITDVNKDLLQNCISFDRDISSIFKLIKEIKQINPHILHIHAARGIVIGRIVAFICNRVFKLGIKVLSTSHGLWLPQKKDNRIFKYLMHFMKDIDSCTIAVSDRSKKELLDLGYSPDKVKSIYNGVDFSKFDRYRSIKKYVKNISFVGRFTDQKGIKFLLEAIKKDENSFNFNIFGDGELREYITNYIAQYNLKNVQLNGYSKNVGEVFQNTDILLAPSIDEGLPYTLVEAINCGVPLISTRVGGIPEILYDGENGILIESGSVSQITEALNTLKTVDVESLSKKAIDISQKFSINNMVEQVENLYVYLLE